MVIYNHFDSYPVLMGAELFRQLAVLLQRFRGDVRQASRSWGDLVAALVLTYNEDGETNPFNVIHAFDDIERSLRSTLPVVVYEGEGLEDDMWIEFVWTVDLDDCALTMRTSGGRAKWSFADIHRGRAFADEWILEAEHAACGPDRLEDSDAEADAGRIRNPFARAVESRAAVQIQASARRYLEVSRGLCPGGVLAKLAAARFRRAAALLA